MHEPKEKIVNDAEMQQGLIKSATSFSNKMDGIQIMQAMAMNRAERRAFAKTNNGLKILGSNKPVVNTKSK